MERRKFIRGAGILGLFAAGAVGMKFLELQNSL